VFSGEIKIVNGVAGLEVELRDFLIRGFLDASKHFPSETIEDRKKYLSFRVMDVLSSLVGMEGPS